MYSWYKASTVLRTASWLSIGRLLFCEGLDVVGREEAHHPVDLSLPPLPVLLAQDGDHAALVKAQLIRRLSCVGV